MKRSGALVGLCVLAACNKSAPAPSREPPPAPPPSASAVAPRTIPVLVAEPFTAGQDRRGLFFRVEGALIVSSAERVGRIDGDNIEWVGKIPKFEIPYGDLALVSVHGRWPDELAAIFVSANGRAARPTYYPLTGKGERASVGGGGGLATIAGVARVGDSTVIGMFSSMDGDFIATVRGPELSRRLTPAKEKGCRQDERIVFVDDGVAAIPATAFASSPAGTLVSLGRLCGTRGPVAEVWEKGATTSRILPLDRWWKQLDGARLLEGSGDDLYAFSDPYQPVLRFRGTEIEPIADLERPIEKLFVSSKGQLFAYDGRRVHRYEEARWTTVARFEAPAPLSTMVTADDGTFWASQTGDDQREGRIYRLRENGQVSVDDPCTTPFVYLYRVSANNAKDYTFPSTRAALASFPDAALIGLVEFPLEDGGRRLGVTVTSREQGQALIAHLEATLKDETPKLVCYEPGTPRKIPLDAK